MFTKIYEVADEDVMARFFGPDSDPIPLTDFAVDHGSEIWKGTLKQCPGEGDCLVVDDTEYVVVLRIYKIVRNEKAEDYPGEDYSMIELIVHPRHYIEATLS